MTAQTSSIPLACPPANLNVEAPKKRRRRAAASGAADDCFACHKRSLKCDRRRPYCSPCLEIGSECSGYKTKLTWDVGVASRGKLRGLSLPVARSAPVSRSPERMFSQRASTTNKLMIQHERVRDIEVRFEYEQPIATPYTNYHFVNMKPKSPSSPAPSDWGQSDYIASSHEDGSHDQLLRQSLSRLQPPNMRYGDDLSSSTGSLSSYSDNDYSPVAQSFNDSAYLSPMAYECGTSPEHTFSTLADQRGLTSFPDQLYMQSPSSHHSFDDGSQSSVTHSESESEYNGEYVGSYSQSSGFISVNKWDTEEPLQQQQQPLQIVTQPQFPTFGIFGVVSPRLSFYLNFYEKIICPITVAIDSPDNPYRCEILRLASSSPSLQHAICALASCNLRTRRRQSLQIGQWTTTNVPATQLSANSIPLDDASVAEEYHHRSLAVSLLNSQLSTPELAMQDSVLATLLMLCHYRMCETGIAQFKTQFAGVKKLLGIRAAAGMSNDGWMESIFTFFDAITASVNEREAQLGEYQNLGESPQETASSFWRPVQPSSPSQQYDGYPLENLAGICGRLFKTVAKLGKLNMLSRGEAEEIKDPWKQNRDASHPQTYAHLPHSPNYHQHTAPNCWISSPGNSQANYSSSPPTYGPISGPGTRHAFWALWREIRHALQTWHFDASTIHLPLPPRPEQLRDFAMVSEAFRHAALLYTERLANPGLPSSDVMIQGHVSQVFFYITSLDNSDGKGLPAGKFLLWPLFVAGSEACAELERNMVRERCNGISRRGGYANNMAGLEALERVWKLLDNEGRTRSRAFSWERDGWMAQVEGEFIMA